MNPFLMFCRDNEEIDPAKVLMGLNFYGNLYKKLGEGGPIIGHEYLDILDRERPPIAWDAGAAEHMATLRDRADPNRSKRHVVVRADPQCSRGLVCVRNEFAADTRAWESMPRPRNALPAWSCSWARPAELRSVASHCAQY